VRCAIQSVVCMSDEIPLTVRGEACAYTNCVCLNHEGWPQRTGAFWTHLYSESPKVITPRGKRPATQYVVVER
jgi:hypothetical protein